MASTIIAICLQKVGIRRMKWTGKIHAAYQQLFHGDPQTQAVYFEAGKNANGKLAYITDWANHDVRTEGMSYGMMVAVQLGDKEVFDSLWNWAMTYMYLPDPKHSSHGYFSWSCKTDGTPNEETPAPDGEEYFAMALLFAGNRWPGGVDIYDYHARAEALLHAMVHREVLSAMTRFGPRTVGPEMDKQHSMVLFVPGTMPHPFTIPRITSLPSTNSLLSGDRRKTVISGGRRRMSAGNSSRKQPTPPRD